MGWGERELEKPLYFMRLLCCNIEKAGLRANPYKALTTELNRGIMFNSEIIFACLGFVKSSFRSVVSFISWKSVVYYFL